MSDTPEPTSIANIGDLAKPVTTLIEKISDATGAVFAPWQIKRVAKAEAEANKIKALTEIEITEIQERTKARLITEEIIKQQNIESIITKALPELKEDAKPENIKPDWFLNFFENCKYVSDEQMQEIWAKVLAFEANKPGRFSKRTIDVFSKMEKEEVEHFNNFSNLIFEEETYVFTYHDSVCPELGIDLALLINFENIGLVNVHKFPRLDMFRTYPFKRFKYCDYFVKIDSRNIYPNIPNHLYYIVLTKIGKEMMYLCSPQFNQIFVEYLQQISPQTAVKFFLEKDEKYYKKIYYVLDSSENLNSNTIKFQISDKLPIYSISLPSRNHFEIELKYPVTENEILECLENFTFYDVETGKTLKNVKIVSIGYE